MKKIISLLLCFTLICGMPFTAFAASNTALAQTLAEDLKELNLFFGVSENNNFDLERAPTRVEALVMLIRVLGAEKEVLDGTWEHPFTDVPAWADKYVGYGYEKGLANGVGYNTFGTGRANAAMYLTFVLRSLGYTEKEDNFTWDKPFELARTVGILSEDVNTANFLRGDVVLVSYAALNVKLKGDTKTLAEKLIEAGVFTKQVFDAYYDANMFTTTNEELDAEEIYAKCSPAVFYIEVANTSGQAVSSGSGFFISSDGVAVTNYHVIEDAVAAEVTLANTQETYNVKGVLSYSREEDWAVIKVDAENLPYIEIGDPSTIVGGAEIFAIGSPLGLQNTISQGIISNVSRTIQETEYIQITAAISPGSSGGALINKYGEVIGITTGSIEEGQSINLAVPTSKVRGYENASLKTLMTINTPSQSSNASITGAKVIARSAFEALYKIATEQKTFDYGGYVSWTGYDADGDSEIAVVYNVVDDVLFAQYKYYPDGENSTIYQASIFFNEHAGYDEVLFAFYSDKNTKLLSGDASVFRMMMDSDNILPFDMTERDSSLDWFTADTILREGGSNATWLALDALNSVLEMMTNGAWSVEDLGYINLYR